MLKPKLAEILDKVLNLPTELKKEVREKFRDESLTAILSAIREELPKEKITGLNLDDYRRYGNGGYNQCLTDIKKLLE